VNFVKSCQIALTLRWKVSIALSEALARMLGAKMALFAEWMGRVTAIQILQKLASIAASFAKNESTVLTLKQKAKIV